MKTEIIINDDLCQIKNLTDPSIIRDLDNELSFFVQGAEHSTAYKGYYNKHGKSVNWDGYKRLLSPALRFSLGLLPRVERFLNNHNHPYIVLDNRPLIKRAPECDISAFLANMGKTPFPHQIEALEAAKAQERGIIRIATGGGKSIVSAMITAYFNKPTIIYVIGKDLLYQFHDLFSKIFQTKIGIIGDGKCEVHKINIASIWSIGQAFGLKKQPDDDADEITIPKEKYQDIRQAATQSAIHILDECHLAACDTIQGLFKILKPERLYGLSASPWRDDGADLLVENYLGTRIIDISAKTLIDSGHLVKPLIKFISTPKMKGLSNKKYQTIYSSYIINNDDRNEMIAKAAIKLTEQNYQTLVLFHNISHGEIIYDLLKDKISCELLSGADNSKTREATKKKLESREINCIIASKIFDIGVDLPSLSGLVVAGGGKSSVRALQRIGRVIRQYPGKTNAAIIDFADQAPYLLDHAEIRKKIYEQEFEVKWPEPKK